MVRVPSEQSMSTRIETEYGPRSGERAPREPVELASCRTLSELFLARVAATPDALAFQYPGDGGHYRGLSWREAGERVRAIAAGLRALGLGAEERCAIVSGTRIEWILADLAILCASGATTTVYPGCAEADYAHVLRDSGSAFAFVESASELARLRALRAELPELRRVVVFEGEIGPDDWAISLADFEALGQGYDRAEPGELERVARSIQPGQLATLVYTSGTTGRAKGVRLCHDGWLYQAEVGLELGLWSEQDHQYLWLPLAHVFGKVIELCAIRVGFPTTVDARVERLMENLARVRPTFMGAPPRVFERIFRKLELAAEQRGALARKSFAWACRIARRVSRLRRRGREAGGLLGLEYALAERLVFSKVRALFGGRMRFLFSGSAALPEELAEFFHGAGLLILEGYGLTESSAGAVLNRMDAFAFGSVGKPLPGTELALADDGEVLLRSRGVMQGYHGLADETRAALGEDGWLRTGDLGELDAQGFLRITGRKKDLFKTSSGLYVAPSKIEGLLRAASGCLAHVVVHGERRAFPTALIAIDAEAFAQHTRTAVCSPAELALDPAAAELARVAIAGVNALLPAHERIRRFALLPDEPSVANGLLTPSMKLRRRALEERYELMLEELYRHAAPADAALPIWIPIAKEKRR